MLFYSNKFFASSLKSAKTCAQRSRFLSYSKSLLSESIPIFRKHLLKISLKVSTLFLSNLTYLNCSEIGIIHDLKNHIRTRTGELTPELTLKLLDCISVNPEEIDKGILHDINIYFNANIQSFSEQQVKNVENYYYLIDTKIRLPFNPLMSDKQARLEAKLHMTLRERSDLFLKTQNITFPKDVIVTMENLPKKMGINFLKTKQRLTLYGIQHMDKIEVLEMRREAYKQKKPIIYFFERPPFEYFTYKLLTKDQEKKVENDMKLKKLFFEEVNDSDLSLKKTPAKILASVGEISCLNKECLDFYVTNYLLNNPKKLQLDESENLLYTPDWGLKKVDELSSLLYILNKNQSSQFKDSLFVLADIPLLDEIQFFTEKQSNEDLKELFQILRIAWINEIIYWTRRVNKNGCPACCKQNSFGPNDIYNSLGEGDFNMSIREGIMAYKIIKGMMMNQDLKEAIGFFGSDHILEIAKNIGNIIEFDKEILDKYEDFNGGIMEKNKELVWPKINLKNVVNDDDLMEEKISKWALLAAAFTKDNLVLQENIKDKQELFNTYCDEYRKLLHPLNLGVDWNPMKGAKRCYASEILFKE